MCFARLGKAFGRLCPLAQRLIGWKLRPYCWTVKGCDPSSFALFRDQICHKFGAFFLNDWKRILLEHAQSVFLPIDILLGLAAAGF